MLVFFTKITNQKISALKGTSRAFNNLYAEDNELSPPKIGTTTVLDGKSTDMLPISF